MKYDIVERIKLKINIIKSQLTKHKRSYLGIVNVGRLQYRKRKKMHKKSGLENLL